VNHSENQARLELEELFRNQGITDRGIDNVVATPDLPEEYGFIFRNAGYQDRMNHENLALFTQLCKKKSTQFQSKSTPITKKSLGFSKFFVRQEGLARGKIYLGRFGPKPNTSMVGLGFLPCRKNRTVTI